MSGQSLLSRAAGVETTVSLRSGVFGSSEGRTNVEHLAHGCHPTGPMNIPSHSLHGSFRALPSYCTSGRIRSLSSDVALDRMSP